jgi:hypothetical protein
LFEGGHSKRRGYIEEREGKEGWTIDQVAIGHEEIMQTTKACEGRAFININ